jgi:hypothetical protein
MYFWNRGEIEGRDGREMGERGERDSPENKMAHLDPSFKLGSGYKCKSEERGGQFAIFIYFIY